MSSDKNTPVALEGTIHEVVHHHSAMDAHEKVHMQDVLLNLSRVQGELTMALKNNTKEFNALTKSVGQLQKDVDGLNQRAKYWKFGLCLILGAGGIILSLVQFGNEFIQLIKNLSGPAKSM